MTVSGPYRIFRFPVRISPKYREGDLEGDRKRLLVGNPKGKPSWGSAPEIEKRRNREKLPS